jgi:hypothetical protein
MSPQVQDFQARRQQGILGGIQRGERLNAGCGVWAFWGGVGVGGQDVGVHVTMLDRYGGGDLHVVMGCALSAQDLKHAGSNAVSSAVCGTDCIVVWALGLSACI